jgi:hypothetical protein
MILVSCKLWCIPASPTLDKITAHISMVLLHDVWVMLATSSLPLALVACTEILKDTNRLSSAAARKFLHIATGMHAALIEAHAGKGTPGTSWHSLFRCHVYEEMHT